MKELNKKPRVRDIEKEKREKKICSICNEEKLLFHFRFMPQCKSGYLSHCKYCQSIKRHTYYLNNECTPEYKEIKRQRQIKYLKKIKEKQNN